MDALKNHPEERRVANEIAFPKALRFRDKTKGPFETETDHPIWCLLLRSCYKVESGGYCDSDLGNTLCKPLCLKILCESTEANPGNIGSTSSNEFVLGFEFRGRQAAKERAVAAHHLSSRVATFEFRLEHRESLVRCSEQKMSEAILAAESHYVVKKSRTPDLSKWVFCEPGNPGERLAVRKGCSRSFENVPKEGSFPVNDNV